MRVLLAILAVAAGPVMHDTTAGNAKAKAALLTQADLGKGWSGTPSPQQGVTFGCKGYAPSGLGVVEVGGAAGPAFGFGTNGTGPFLFQKASVYKTAGQADLYWRRSVTAKLASCAAQVLEAVSSRGVKVTLTQQGPLKFSSTLAHHAGYRAAAILQSKTNKLKNYVDVLVVGDGRTITVVTISSFVNPPPKAFEEIISHELTKKLGGGSA